MVGVKSDMISVIAIFSLFLLLIMIKVCRFYSSVKENNIPGIRITYCSLMSWEVRVSIYILS